MYILIKNKVERRPVVRIGIPDTIVTIDNRKTALSPIVQIAGTDHETEPGVFDVSYRFFRAKGSTPRFGAGHACPLLLTFVTY